MFQRGLCSGGSVARPAAERVPYWDALLQKASFAALTMVFFPPVPYKSTLFMALKAKSPPICDRKAFFSRLYD